MDAIAQAYAELCDLAKDPSQGANYVTVMYDGDHSIKTSMQIDEALLLLGDAYTNNRYSLGTQSVVSCVGRCFCRVCLAPITQMGKKPPVGKTD